MAIASRIPLRLYWSKITPLASGCMPTRESESEGGREAGREGERRDRDRDRDREETVTAPGQIHEQGIKGEQREVVKY